jgi:hypothetical protein
MRKSRVIGTSLCALALGLGARLEFSFIHFHHVEREFPSVQLGQSSDSVISMLGKPNYHSGECLQDLTNSATCNRQLVYSYPFAPLIPEYYVVSFSSDDKVIDAEKLDSP